EASQRYQRSRPGHFHHAARQARYRRGREKVTHQTSPPAVASGMVAGTPPSVMVTGEPAPEEATDVDALDGSPAGSGPHARARARWSRPDSQSSPAGAPPSSPPAAATRPAR